MIKCNIIVLYDLRVGINARTEKTQWIEFRTNLTRRRVKKKKHSFYLKSLYRKPFNFLFAKIYLVKSPCNMFSFSLKRTFQTFQGTSLIRESLSREILRIANLPIQINYREFLT